MTYPTDADAAYWTPERIEEQSKAAEAHYARMTEMRKDTHARLTEEVSLICGLLRGLF